MFTSSLLTGLADARFAGMPGIAESSLWTFQLSAFWSENKTLRCVWLFSVLCLNIPTVSPLRGKENIVFDCSLFSAWTFQLSAHWGEKKTLCLTVLCSLPEHFNCQPIEVKTRHCVWLAESLLASILICLLWFVHRFQIEQWISKVATSCVKWLTIWPPISDLF